MVDTGTAIFLAALVQPISLAVNAWFVHRALVKSNKTIANALEIANDVTSRKLDENTELTLKVEKSTNSMKDALVEATRQAAEAKGLALGIVEGRAQAKVDQKE